MKKKNNDNAHAFLKVTKTHYFQIDGLTQWWLVLWAVKCELGCFGLSYS